MQVFQFERSMEEGYFIASEVPGIDQTKFVALADIENLVADAKRYRFLRDADIEAVKKGGVFAGITPENLVLNGVDLDKAIDNRIEI